MDIVKYTDHEIIKNFALLENHLKQAQSGIDEVFCEDCINKHLVLLEGLAEEGMNAGGNEKKYEKVYNFAEDLKNKDYKKHGIDFSDKARKIRKSMAEFCLECEEKLGEKNIKAIKNITKHLNNPFIFYNQLNGAKKNMVDFQTLGTFNAGQFVAEGVRYLAETQAPAYEKYITLGGGVLLQALPLLTRLPKWVEQLSIISGSNLFAGGVVKLVRGGGTTVTARRVRATSSSGATSGGVVAKRVPTQYARAGISGRASAQRFESPEHADLLRID